MRFGAAILRGITLRNKLIEPEDKVLVGRRMA
jgi:hypothetical protein